jgi:hypothetical protein
VAIGDGGDGGATTTTSSANAGMGAMARDDDNARRNVDVAVDREPFSRNCRRPFAAVVVVADGCVGN